MFGFLAVYGGDDTYCGLYSRCCQHQRCHYGLIGLPLLSYESVFLYALGLDVGLGGSYSPPRRRCCRLRTDGKCAESPDAQLGEFVAATGMLLASVKLQDDLRDSRSRTSRVIRQLASRLLDRRFKHAQEYFNRLDSNFTHRMQEHLQSHLAAESAIDRLDAEEYSRPTSAAFGDLFGLMSHLPRASDFAFAFREIGRQVGTAIVLHDCATDWNSDLRQKLPNPVRDAKSAKHVTTLTRVALAAAKDATIAIGKAEGHGSQILAAVERRLNRTSPGVLEKCTGYSPGVQCGQTASQSVVLHATCCCPCGDGAVVFESKEAERCCGQVCAGACCWFCICSWCYNSGCK